MGEKQGQWFDVFVSLCEAKVQLVAWKTKDNSLMSLSHYAKEVQLAIWKIKKNGLMSIACKRSPSSGSLSIALWYLFKKSQYGNSLKSWLLQMALMDETLNPKANIATNWKCLKNSLAQKVQIGGSLLTIV